MSVVVAFADDFGCDSQRVAVDAIGMAGKKPTADITGAQVRAARALLDLSQGELAEVAGIARVTLTTLESGRRVSYDATMQSVVTALRERGIVFVNDANGVGVVLERQEASRAA